MFLNFPVAETYQEFSGIDLTPFKTDIAEMNPKPGVVGQQPLLNNPLRRILRFGVWVSVPALSTL
jgi:hypothetical protein